MKLAIALIAAGIVSGCATTQAPEQVIHLWKDFDQAQAERQMAPGTGTLNGNAFLRQRGGGVVTCAGSTVYLIPATDYATERIRISYGSTDAGYSPSPAHRFEPDYFAYQANTKSTTCNSQGNFQFSALAAGTFYVVTNVSWTVGYSEQGGHLMQRVTIEPDKAMSVVISR